MRSALRLAILLLAACGSSSNGTRGDASVNPDAPAPPPCDLDATTETFDAQVDAATAGQTICLAPGDYGMWQGTDKAIAIRSADNATATLGIDVRTGAEGFTLYGLTIAGGRIADGANGITIRESTFTDSLMIDGVANANILLDHNRHVGINTCAQCLPGMISLSYSSDTPSGVTISHSLFAEGNSDGIQTGVGVDIIGNEFRDLREMSDSDPAHTDSIQLLDAPGSHVRGNYIHNCADGIVAYDGVRDVTIEDNVIELVDGRWGIELYSDHNSIVRHNTLVWGAGCAYAPCGQIMLDHKDADPAGTGTIIEDNIATWISEANGSTSAKEDHNLVRQDASAGDTLGEPIYSGGAMPATWDGFHLAAGSPGWGAASDGTNIGIR